MNTMLMRNLGAILTAVLITGAPSHSADIIEPAFPSLQFTRPVDLQHAGDGSGRLFVAEQRGVIQVFENDHTTVSSTVFLDISDIVDDEGSEKGLLGVAFHPEYEENGYFYVSYTAADPFRGVISRFSVSDDPDIADPASEMVLIELPQLYHNQNNSQVAFGPDGYLYIGFGDGGSGGDPHGHGQNRATLDGSIVRIDIDNPEPPLMYGIPPDNPFAGNDQGFREEIYAYGLRNPWRFSFDPVSGLLWAGDVGQSTLEEVDVIVNGGNYGWNIMEGTTCYDSEDCDTSGLILPVVEYNRDFGRAVIGGYVYRGTRMPSLIGRYIFGDFVSGNIWALQYEDSELIELELLPTTVINISAFGIDEQQELYLVALNGTIYRFVEEVTAVEDDVRQPVAFATATSFPNPFNASTTLTFSVPTDGAVTVSVYNIAGQLVDTILQDRLSAGEHRLHWTPDGLSGGVYFMRVAAPGGGVTARVVYLP